MSMSTSESLLPKYPNGWPASHRSEDLFRFVVEHVSASLATPASSVTELSPWVTSSSSDLHRAIVKRLRIDSLEVEGKVLTNSFDVGTSFARELRFFRTVSPHPNLVEFYGHIDRVGLVIEAIDGVTIHDKIEKAPFPSDTVKLRWANQLIQAILHIHSFGLSHGDISPGNVLIDSESNVKLIDFGRSARVKEELFPASHPFTAPDNMHSKDDPTLNDAYALGVLLLCLERNQILEDMVPTEELQQMPLPLFGHLIRGYTVADRKDRPKIDLSHMLPAVSVEVQV